MAFIPIIVPKSKNPKTNAFALIVIGLIVIAVSLIVAVSDTSLPPEPVDTALLSVDELKTGSGWLIEDAVVCDQYAYTTEDDVTKSIECAVAFEVKGGQWAVASLKVPLGTALYDEIDGYLADSSLYVGDLRMPLCVTTASLASDFKQYLNQYAADIGLTEKGVHVVPVEMTYRGRTAEEYVKAVESAKRSAAIAGIGFAVVGALMVGFGIVSRRKEKEKALEQAAARQSVFTDNDNFTGGTGL